MTPADVKRARYFGLTIPAPAKVEVPVVVAPVVEVAAPTQAVEVEEPTGPRPTRLERFTPTTEMEMEHFGYTLGLAGENASAPEGHSFPELVAFHRGFLQGEADLEAEYNVWLDEVAAEHDRMDDAFGSPEETWHESELAECGSRSGHPAYEG